MKQLSTRISFPPLRPEDKTARLFKLLNDYYTDIASHYQQNGQLTLKQLDRLEEKLSILLSNLHFLYLHVAFAHAMQPVQKTPSAIKRQLQRVSPFLLSLDRDHYRGFLKRTLDQIKKLRKKAVELNMKIVQDVDRWQQKQQQQQRIPPLLFQSSSIPHQSTNQMSSLPPPAPLRRQQTRYLGPHAS